MPVGETSEWRPRDRHGPISGLGLPTDQSAASEITNGPISGQRLPTISKSHVNKEFSWKVQNKAAGNGGKVSLFPYLESKLTSQEASRPEFVKIKWQWVVSNVTGRENQRKIRHSGSHCWNARRNGSGVPVPLSLTWKNAQHYQWRQGISSSLSMALALFTHRLLAWDVVASRRFWYLCGNKTFN